MTSLRRTCGFMLPSGFRTRVLNKCLGRVRPGPRRLTRQSSALAGYKSVGAVLARMDLESSTWTDADAADTDLALLPVGSTEQHGPHDPLATDTLLAEAVAAAGAEAYDGDVVVAPTLPYGISEEHRGFAGTLWLSPDVFRDAVGDVVRSLDAHGWNRVVIVNGHGGNTAALREAGRDLSTAEGRYVTTFTWFDSLDLDRIGDEAVSMGHAGPVETAALLATHPELVHEDRLASAAAGAADRWGSWLSGVNMAYGVDEFSENGTVGDPTAGDADLGRAVIAEATDALVALMDAVTTRDLD